MDLVNIQLLYKLKRIFGIGIIKEKKDKVIYIIKDNNYILKNIIPIFEEYPLLTNKQYNYI
jgi:hypothetical protein